MFLLCGTAWSNSIQLGLSGGGGVQASSKMGTGFFNRGVRGRIVAFTTHRHLSQRLNKEQICRPISSFRAG